MRIGKTAKGTLWIFIISIALIIAIERISTWQTQNRVDELVQALGTSLTPGLPGSKVEEQLDRLQIKHTRDASNQFIQGKREGIGRYRLIYDTELHVKVYLDPSGRLMRYDVRTFYWGL